MTSWRVRITPKERESIRTESTRVWMGTSSRASPDRPMAREHRAFASTLIDSDLQAVTWQLSALSRQVTQPILVSQLRNFANGTQIFHRVPRQQQRQPVSKRGYDLVEHQRRGPRVQRTSSKSQWIANPVGKVECFERIEEIDTTGDATHSGSGIAEKLKTGTDIHLVLLMCSRELCSRHQQT